MLRLLMYGVPGTPVFEICERLSDFHDLPFITIEKDTSGLNSYFSDKIPSVRLDTGDLTDGSSSSSFSRDINSFEKNRYLDIPLNVSIDYLSLDDSELSELSNLLEGIVATEIPDSRLSNWATHVVFLNCNESSAVSWYSKRLKCPSCGNVHHLEDKPSLVSGICDRCGTDLIRQSTDEPSNIKRQYLNWRNSFWRLKKSSEDLGKLHIYASDKFPNLDELIKTINRDYRSYIG